MLQEQQCPLAIKRSLLFKSLKKKSPEEMPYLNIRQSLLQQRRRHQEEDRGSIHEEELWEI